MYVPESPRWLEYSTRFVAKLMLIEGPKSFPSSKTTLSRPLRLPLRGSWLPLGNDGLAVSVREQCSRLSSAALRLS